jgi:dTDP-glucose pyrophosphorylase
MIVQRQEGWHSLSVKRSASIIEAAKVLQDTGLRIVLVVDESGSHLEGVITDGDIRRGLLEGIATDEACSLITNERPQTVDEKCAPSEVKRIMTELDLTALPITGQNRKVSGIWLDVVAREKLKNPVVIMAGGKGTRLRPITSSTPKPLVSIAGRPMLHHILDGLASEGFLRVFISVNYLGEQIEESVGDGSSWGLAVSYLREPTPLGTAGSLGLLPEIPESPLLVMNADLVTSANLRELVVSHEGMNSDLSVGMRVHDIEHPFGVLDVEGRRVLGIREKPVWREFVSAGVYVISPRVLELVEQKEHLDMPELVAKAIAEGLSVEGFPLHESWLDVGTPSDYARAQHMVGD